MHCLRQGESIISLGIICDEHNCERALMVCYDVIGIMGSAESIVA